METVKIVLVKHPNDTVNYAFQVPDAEDLVVGQKILCSTNRGNDQIGVCITPSFTVSDNVLREYYGTTVSKLKPVTGILIPFMFVDTKETDDGKENG